MIVPNWDIMHYLVITNRHEYKNLVIVQMDRNTRLQYVCVSVFSSHSFPTSSSLDVPAGVTQEGGHTGFFIHLPSVVRALLFLARRFSHSFPSSTVKSNF